MTTQGLDQNTSETSPSNQPKDSALNVFKAFLSLGLMSFGGPAAHIGYFHQAFVKDKKWLSDAQFSQLLAICQFLPGPASSQLGFAIGLLRGGWLGALAAFVAFTLPSVILLIAFAYSLDWLPTGFVDPLVHGLKIFACVVVLDAVMTMATKLCPNWPLRVIAIASALFLILASSASAQLLVILMGVILGVIWNTSASNQAQNMSIPLRYSSRTAFFAFMVFLFFLGFALVTPVCSGMTGIFGAFYQAGAFVFGGGHVVLPLLQESVVTTGLISEDAFLSGYGASQAIPGPMFSFAAYLGALIPGGAVSISGALVALLAVFLPGFLLLVACLPIWGKLSSYPLAANAVAGVNAAVVGLLAAALYDPIMTSALISYLDIVIAVIAAVLFVKFKASFWKVLGFCVMSSMLISLLT